MNWILASGSPRRRELLEMLGVPDLTIRPATGPERATPGAGPEQTVRELSLHKAQEVAQTCAPGGHYHRGGYDRVSRRRHPRQAEES